MKSFSQNIVTLHPSSPHRYSVHVNRVEIGFVQKWKDAWYTDSFGRGFEDPCKAADQLIREKMDDRNEAIPCP